MADKPWKAFERRVANRLSEWRWGEKGHLTRSERSGARATVLGIERGLGDVVPVTDEDAENWPWVVECKRSKSWDWDATMRGKGDVIGWWNKVFDEAIRSEMYPMLVISRPGRPGAWVLVSGYINPFRAVPTTFTAEKPWAFDEDGKRAVTSGVGMQKPDVLRNSLDLFDVYDFAWFERGGGL